ncbi:hypothetical protein RvY_10263 [Ramazzottius varieornatus]|uniref:Serine-threonine/tyrosine-protein kinase catalytic domain-containing protein n=1 Tax=Ramazzottius varieornatus TaxID=947166 RepID=A0A1D1VC68_RAMVA|nr:hypothetical protein RvY_10263 [Ramazzottius varieornatus]
MEGAMERTDNALESSSRTTGAGSGDVNCLTTRDSLNFSYQMARGMEHLSDIIYRDLVAKNMLVDTGKLSKS